jgi:putative NADH-flavin reductase
MARIVVFGGSGYAGGSIAAEAARRGHEVTSVSRSGTAVPGIETVTGSITDEPLVATLAADTDVLVVAVTGTTVAGVIDRLVTIAGSTGARLGVVGGAGSLLVADGGPRLVDTPDFHAEWKDEALAHADVLAALRAGPPNLEWFYLSPPALFGAWTPGETTGAYRVSGDLLLSAPDGGPSEISGTDYATAFVDEIDEPRHTRERFHVAH